MKSASSFWLSDTAIKRPVIAVVIVLLIGVFGVVSIWRLPVREQPAVDPPKVSIATVYPGASARVVDRDVTDVIEANLNGIDGIDQIVSSTRDQFSQITIEFETGRDLDAAAADVRDKVGGVRSDLPDRVDPPVISKASADSQAIMWITLRSDTRDRKLLTDLAERRLVDPLSVVPGVAQVVIGGARRFAVRITLDPDAMAAQGVTVADVTNTLRAENVELPAGRIVSDARELTVRSMTRFPSPEAFEAMSIRQTGAGRITLGDVARVAYGPEDDRSAVFVDGEPSVGLGIVRQSGANSLEVTDAVKRRLDALDRTLPDDITVSISYDRSIFIEASLRQIVETLAITAALVLGVILLFLGSLRAAFVPAVTIPVALCGAVIALWALGLTINTLTLLALVVAMGLVVDDAIVVLENVTRLRRDGVKPLKAGIDGTRQVAFAVISTTIVLVAVLVPIFFMAGTTGRLFTEFAVAMGAAIIFSSLAALTIGAAIATHSAPDTTGESNGGDGGRQPGMAGRVDHVVERLTEIYGRFLEGVFRAWWLVLLLAIGLVVGTVLIFRSLPGELAPTEDRAVIIIPVETPQGSTLAVTEAAVREVGEIIKPYMGEGRDHPVESYIAIVGTGRNGPPQVNNGLIIVKLKRWENRAMAQTTLTDRLKGPLLALESASAVAVNPPTLVSTGFGKPIQQAVTALEYQTALDIGRKTIEAARGDPALASLELDLSEDQPQVQLTVDRVVASRIGVSAREISETLNVFLSGREVTDFYLQGESYEVVVRGAADDRNDPGDIESLYLTTASGDRVPLASIVSRSVVGVSPVLGRVDRKPAATISAVPGPGYTLAEALSALEDHARPELTGDATLAYKGLTKEFVQSSAGVTIAFLLAVMIVILILAALFDSFLAPLVILLALPLALGGGILALWLLGGTMNIYTQIGALLIIGLLAKNAILVVDFANQQRRDGASVSDAIREAALKRFRPVMMTSIATGLGALPLILAGGAGAEGRSVLGAVILGGIIASTVVTLTVVPLLYRAIGPFMSPPGNTRDRVEEQLAE